MLLSYKIVSPTANTHAQGWRGSWPDDPYWNSAGTVQAEVQAEVPSDIETPTFNVGCSSRYCRQSHQCHWGMQGDSYRCSMADQEWHTREDKGGMVIVERQDFLVFSCLPPAATLLWRRADVANYVWPLCQIGSLGNGRLASWSLLR
jgi:hypothetical protein